MSYLPSLSSHREGMNPYERQISSVQKRPPHNHVQPQQKPTRSHSNKSLSLKPIKPRKNNRKSSLVSEESITEMDPQYADMSFMQKMDLAVESFQTQNEYKPGDKKEKMLFRKIANSFGLDWKVVRRFVEFEERDVMFFEHFSIEIVIDEITDLFPVPPLRYFLITGSPQENCGAWGSSPFVQDMDSSESGGLPKEYISEQCKQWACALEGNTFISLNHPDVKKNMLKRNLEINNKNPEMFTSPRQKTWNKETLSSLCSTYVLLHEKNIPPHVLFSKITKSKKSSLHSCGFAFVLFDKYIVMLFPNYFHFMCSYLKDPMKMGSLLHRYAEINNSINSKFVNVIRIKELTSPIKKSYDLLKEDESL